MSYIDTLRIDDIDYEIKDSKAIHTDEWLDFAYPIGSLYWNRVNSDNPSEYLGGEWRRITDQVIVAAGSTFPINTSGGSKDAVVVSHNHEQNSHNHEQNSHNHEQNSHNHEQYSHSHTQGSHYHGLNPSGSLDRRFLAVAGSFNNNIVFAASSSGKWKCPAISYAQAPPAPSFESNEYTSAVTPTINSVAAANKAATATNKAATATNKAVTATNKAAGVSGTNKNMPPYITAYCWERIG